MAVERIVTGVDDAAHEPAAISAHRWIEYLFGRFDPVDLLRGLRPECFRVAQPPRIDLVIPAHGFGIHWRFLSLRLILRSIAPISGIPEMGI